jgi:hypothetical protein
MADVPTFDQIKQLSETNRSESYKTLKLTMQGQSDYVVIGGANKIASGAAQLPASIQNPQS